MDYNVKYFQLSMAQHIALISEKIEALEVAEEYDAIASIFIKSKHEQKESLLEQLSQEKAVIQDLSTFYNSMIQRLKEAAALIDDVQNTYGNSSHLTVPSGKEKGCLS